MPVAGDVGMNASTSSPPPSSPSCPPLSTLAIAGRAGHAFPPHAMLQGFTCHARGVELAASSAARVHARVRSKRVHDVHLRAEQGRLVIACTCPARSLGVDFCKHAWAALLEVDRQNALSDLRRTHGPLVVQAAPSAPAPASPDASKEPEQTRRTKAAAAAEPAPPKPARAKKVTPPSAPTPAPAKKKDAKSPEPAKRSSASRARAKRG